MTPWRSARVRIAIALAVVCAAASTASAQRADYRAWIEEMKASPQGPFGGIGWFCVDGAVLGPRAGCSAHGGGIQHGTWSQRTLELRADDYKIANILADLEPAPVHRRRRRSSACCGRSCSSAS